MAEDNENKQGQPPLPPVENTGEATPSAPPAGQPPQPAPLAQPPTAAPQSTKQPTKTADPPTSKEGSDNATPPSIGFPIPKKDNSTPTLPLGARLVQKGLISEDQLEVALREQREQSANERQMLGAILVTMGFITESALGAVLTETTGVQHFDIKGSVLDSKLINQVPKDVAIRYKALPVAFSDETVTVATADIYNILAVDQMRRYFPPNYNIVPVYSPESEIMEAIEQYYDYEMSISGILKEMETGVIDAELSGESEGYVNPTVRLVDALLIDAIKAGASDIHFEPEGTFLRLRYRIDGQMLQIRSFHKEYWSAIIVRIKIMSGMNIAETRAPQDGRITYNVLGREIDFRVASQPTVHGENIVMRILDKKKALLPLEDLGFSDKNVLLLKKMLKRPEGIIIVTGPTGSGKTTTLYSVLNYINNIGVNIMTLEDPVEYQLPLIRQSQVREGGAMDFVNGVKSLMRQDPDIIFIGEVRDEPTANMAVRAAMTGHQVFTTLHTNDALSALPRLVDIGIPPHLLSGSLICTIAQRLARKLCDKCKEQHTASRGECKVLGVDSENPPTLYHHVGCDVCHGTGYKGRVAISEIVPVDKIMDELIATGSTRRTLQEHALKSGFTPMIDDGVAKVLKGVTDIDELIRTIDVTSRF